MRVLEATSIKNHLYYGEIKIIHEMDIAEFSPKKIYLIHSNYDGIGVLSYLLESETIKDLIRIFEGHEENIMARFDNKCLVEEEIKMAKLTAKARNKLPKSDFGIPASNKYPMPDKAHAKNAKARASEMAHKGKISPSTKSKIDAKANSILGPGKKKTLKSKAKPRAKS